MHTTRALALMALFSLLWGCKQELWSLKFSENIQANRSLVSTAQSNIRSEYTTAIGLIFLQHGISPDDFELSIDPDDKTVIHISASLDTDKFQAIHEAFTKRLGLSNRGPVTATITATATEDDVAKPAEEHIEMKFDFTIDNEVALTHAVTSHDLVNAALGGVHPNDRLTAIYCNVAATLDSPAAISSFTFDGSNSSIDLPQGGHAYSTDHYRATLSLSDPDLQALYEQGKISFQANRTMGDIGQQIDRRDGKTSRFSIVLGPLPKEVKLENGAVDYWENSALVDQCRSMAAAYGSPFSSTFGTGMDRLVKVTSRNDTR
ncbi:hypothetical protein ACTCUN_04805 [Stutzerimonas balearica]|uniref:hypothetical protein n=1 Tax=Stutzerimonas balearica TaxID=74829 RepID=UPI003F772E9F